MVKGLVTPSLIRLHSLDILGWDQYMSVKAGRDQYSSQCKCSRR